MGRQARIRSPENAELICERLVDGLTLREIGKELDCTTSAIAHWLAEDPEFAQMYARAKVAQAETMSAELLEISDDGSNDWMARASEAGDIVTVPDHEHIQRSKLRVDTRKWLMAKMAPRVYGDRVLQMHSGADGTGPIELAVLTPEQRQAKVIGMIDDAFAPLSLPKPADGQHDGLPPIEDDKG